MSKSTETLEKYRDQITQYSDKYMKAKKITKDRTMNDVIKLHNLKNKDTKYIVDYLTAKNAMNMSSRNWFYQCNGAWFSTTNSAFLKIGEQFWAYIKCIHCWGVHMDDEILNAEEFAMYKQFEIFNQSIIEQQNRILKNIVSLQLRKEEINSYKNIKDFAKKAKEDIMTYCKNHKLLSGHIESNGASLTVITKPLLIRDVTHRDGEIKKYSHMWYPVVFWPTKITLNFWEGRFSFQNVIAPSFSPHSFWPDMCMWWKTTFISLLKSFSYDQSLEYALDALQSMNINGMTHYDMLSWRLPYNKANVVRIATLTTRWDWYRYDEFVEKYGKDIPEWAIVTYDYRKNYKYFAKKISNDMIIWMPDENKDKIIVDSVPEVCDHFHRTYNWEDIYKELFEPGYPEYYKKITG